MLVVPVCRGLQQGRTQYPECLQRSGHEDGKYVDVLAWSTQVKRKCVPIIDYNRAHCSCGRWSGSTREPGESVGAFTYRAHESFKIHESGIERARNGQRVLFEEQGELYA